MYHWRQVMVFISAMPVIGSSMITCSVPSVEKGEATNITCHFDVDLGRNRGTLMVIKQDASDDTQEITSCLWHVNEYRCSCYYNYSCNGLTRDTLTVGILSASKQTEGKFICQILPSDPSKTKPCFLSLKGIPSANEGPTSRNSSSPDTSSKEEVPVHIVWAIVISVVVVTIIMIIVTFFCLKRKWYNKCRTSHRPDHSPRGSKAEFELTAQDSERPFSQALKDLMTIRAVITVAHERGTPSKVAKELLNHLCEERQYEFKTLLNPDGYKCDNPSKVVFYLDTRKPGLHRKETQSTVSWETCFQRIRDQKSLLIVDIGNTQEAGENESLAVVNSLKRVYRELREPDSS